MSAGMIVTVSQWLALVVLVQAGLTGVGLGALEELMLEVLSLIRPQSTRAARLRRHGGTALNLSTDATSAELYSCRSSLILLPTWLCGPEVQVPRT